MSLMPNWRWNLESQPYRSCRCASKQGGRANSRTMERRLVPLCRIERVSILSVDSVPDESTIRGS